MALLDVENLEISIRFGHELLPVVRGVSFSVDENETLGIVGESGCGKSLTALAIMGLLEGSGVRVTGGRMRFGGRDLLAMSADERRHIMGNDMAMIFQEPMTSLNPVYRVGDQIIEALQQHRNLSRRAARRRAIELLDLVRIPEPDSRVDSFPHQLSGGQRQRVMIAMALSCDPKLLIADEPTTALDVTVQKEVLDLMLDLQKRTGTAIILISHDLGVIAETCNSVAVMYWGRLVETAPTDALFETLAHPYTRGLLHSIPAIDRDVDWLDAIPGRVPTIGEQIAGCPFHPRCPRAESRCRHEVPQPREIAPGHLVECHFPYGGDR
ncbi:ABC transporter ATP-binding protein [Sinisalibacter lacisalsi]|uniref:ABC transporter ATP-binding protein n=1 Tax=Sinisalibacter lacisalsi TaxID=1526570 RepID=A0ABQ1QQ17_9RHOB|nr:ABC transporter ATP-binding protein [Sinisalibacter lacisalsi]GGD40433.1 ABC transporter ATP-binding protein [Sinisalibacter lacisalsi]